MRRIAQLIALLLLITVSSAKAQEEVVIHPSDPSPTTSPTESDGFPRSPIFIPSVYLSGNTLLLDGCFDYGLNGNFNQNVKYFTVSFDN